MARGIDYGMGQTNIDGETGIRYGVIPANDLGESWYEASEADYGKPSCPKCGDEAIDYGDIENDEDEDEDEQTYTNYRRGSCSDYACRSCKIIFGSDEAYGEEAQGFDLDDGEYKSHQGGDDCDIFILKSPYYTRAEFCSPCAPGACYLRNSDEDGEKAYCFAPDWFRPWNDDQVTGEYCGEKTSCPYPVWRVEDDELVFQPKQNDENAE